LKLKNGFKVNNAIEELCKGNGTPLLYSQIQNFSLPLKQQLEKFSKNLYSVVPQRAAFKNVCGDIDNYYDGLVGTNEKCPFCGISDILTPDHTKRDALDHYLPKDTYPFNSVNPDNLAPICKTCNTSYKGTNSPIKKVSGRKRKAFYPFAKSAVKLNVKAKFNSTNILKMTKDDVELKITNSRYKEEIETWKDLFGIEERYAIKLSSSDAKVWLDTMLIDFRINPKTKNKSFEQKMKYFEQNPIADDNFLKVPYFNACKQMGIL
jgi:5-methylcytosine-specific restriction endonuclease McrA